MNTSQRQYWARVHATFQTISGKSSKNPKIGLTNLTPKDEDPLEGKLKFSSEGEDDPMAKWKTVVFTDQQEDKAKSERGGGKKLDPSLRKRFETSNMKDNEAYVIM